MSMAEFLWLAFAELVCLDPLFPRLHGTPRVNDRWVPNRIIVINRKGLHWQDMPKDYSKHATLCSRGKR